MFQYLFPIFCFGVVVTGIVLKGVLLAAEMNRSQLGPDTEADQEIPQLTGRRFVGNGRSLAPANNGGGQETAAFNRLSNDQSID
jgi:hypothetical protein